MNIINQIPKIIIISTCLLVSVEVFAQKQNVYFLKNDGKQVSTKDSADYIRIVSEPDSGTKWYNVKEYYNNGKPKLVGKTSTTNGSVLQGQCTTFFPTGKRHQVANYANGWLNGDVYSYYPNGQLYAIRNYSDNEILAVVACNDSTGKVLLAEKNGYFTDYDQDFKQIKDEGNILNGLKNGKWVGFIILDSNKVTYTETYDKGILVSGHSVENGRHYEYTQRETEPEFKGGADKLGPFLTNHIRYPDYAKVNKIQGKVFLRVMIEGDGSVTDVKALRSPNIDLENEAIRVIQLSKWIPGRQYGVPARIKFTLPIDFSLSTR